MRWASVKLGDVIAMGTPVGVGFRRKPLLLMKPGALPEVEQVGQLQNEVVAGCP